MGEFVFVCLLLSLLAIAFALLPFKVEPQVQDDNSQQASNVAVIKARLQELESETEYAHYTSHEREALKQELQMRLLEETDEGVETHRAKSTLWPVALLIAVLLPAGSWALYQKLGAQQDFDLQLLQSQFAVFQLRRADFDPPFQILVQVLERALRRRNLAVPGRRDCH